MWVTFTVALFISLIASYLFFTAHKRRPRALEGIVALTSMMICLGVAPAPIKVVLLVAIFVVEGWRLRWEKVH